MSEGPFSPFETEPKAFDWRGYIRSVGSVPAEVARKLDELADLVNKEGPDGEFLRHIDNYRNPALSLVQSFRDILTQEEREELFDALQKAKR
jgi:hypothetical protein